MAEDWFGDIWRNKFGDGYTGFDLPRETLACHVAHLGETQGNEGGLDVDLGIMLCECLSAVVWVLYEYYSCWLCIWVSKWVRKHQLLVLCSFAKHSLSLGHHLLLTFATDGSLFRRLHSLAQQPLSSPAATGCATLLPGWSSPISGSLLFLQRSSTTVSSFCA